MIFQEDPDVSKLYQLLKKAASDPNSLQEARKTFKENYKWDRFIFCGPFIEDNAKAIEEDGRFITIKNLDVIREILTTFGDMIERIDLSFKEMDATDAKQIVMQINVLHHTIETLELKNCKGDVLNELSNTFEKVFHLAFSSSSSDNLQIASKKLSEIFPNVEYLNVEDTRASDWIFIDNALPNLKEFTVDLPKQGGDNADETQIAEFLRKNLQITKLVIKHSSLKLLNEVNEFLKNLEILQLNGLSENYLNYEGEQIHFHNIRYLKIESENDDKIPVRAVFHRLNDFHLQTKDNFTDKWFEYLDEHVNPNLVRIHIKSDHLAVKYLLGIPEKYTNLHFIDIKTKSQFVANDILRFLKRNKQTYGIEFSIQMDKSEEARLKNRVSAVWSLATHTSGSSTAINIAR